MPAPRPPHRSRLRRGVPLALLLALLAPAATGDAPQPSAQRVISMNPSLTETLLALGAADRLVGVDEYSARLQPEVRALPTVGGLFNPSLETIVGLRPDLVVLVPSAEQRGLQERLASLSIAVLELPNITLDETLDSIVRLGERVGRAEAARERVAAIRRAWREVGEGLRGRSPVSTVLVLQRDPLFVVGRGSWLDAMLQAAGARNLGAELGEPYPRAGVEWLLAAAPELLLDASEDAGPPEAYWSRWPSLPAVAAGRAVALPGSVIRPGPHLDRALRQLAEAIQAGAMP